MPQQNESHGNHVICDEREQSVWQAIPTRSCQIKYSGTESIAYPLGTVREPRASVAIGIGFGKTVKMVELEEGWEM